MIQLQESCRTTLTRYARITAAFLPAAPEPKDDDSPGQSALWDTLEAGAVFAGSVGRQAAFKGEAIVGGIARDRLGQTRPAYRPLLQYALARAGFRVEVDEPPAVTAFPASEGDRIGAGAWQALAAYAGGRGERRWFDALVEHQLPSGQFLKATSRDNPETHWFHELVILHALASYAIAAGRDEFVQAISRAVRFHVEETQPDHATNQPWGLPAFLLEPDGWPVADGMLHAASAHGAVERGAGGLTLMLLADALYCLDKLGIPHE